MRRRMLNLICQCRMSRVHLETAVVINQTSQECSYERFKCFELIIYQIKVYLTQIVEFFFMYFGWSQFCFNVSFLWFPLVNICSYLQFHQSSSVFLQHIFLPFLIYILSMFKFSLFLSIFKLGLLQVWALNLPVPDTPKLGRFTGRTPTELGGVETYSWR